MFNQNPQAKLNQQVQSNSQGVNQQAHKKGTLGKPSIDRPKAAAVPPPKPDTGVEDKKGFSDWVGDKWKNGKEWAKDAAWNATMGKASDAMSDTMNPTGQPGKGQPKHPQSPGAPATERPQVERPTPKLPNTGRIPKPQVPKFRR